MQETFSYFEENAWINFIWNCWSFMTRESLKDNLEQEPSKEDIAKRACNILISYKKRVFNNWSVNNYKQNVINCFNQNKHLKCWEEYAKIVFEQAQIPEKYNDFLINFLKSYLKEKIDKNLLISIIIKNM